MEASDENETQNESSRNLNQNQNLNGNDSPKTFHLGLNWSFAAETPKSRNKLTENFDEKENLIFQLTKLLDEERSSLTSPSICLIM